MNKMYSREDLILYAYNETELTDTVLIQNSIDGDPLVENEYKEILSSINYLDKILLEPDENTMNRLMQVLGLRSEV
jgi:hypothetical protein